MSNDGLGIVVRHLHRLAGRAEGEEISDSRLLEQFLNRHDEEAFTALVRRHGPMVWSACRRILGDEHAAEDAFQATFLVLLRRARSLRSEGKSLAGWLYTVAYHVALKARAGAARRRLKEGQVQDMPRAETQAEQAELIWRDLQPVLDEELNRLPEKYRAPLVLCYLEGKTNEEAGRLLGWPLGTIKSRLARARELLRGRLKRRGITVVPALLGAALADRAMGAVSAALVDTTVRTALLLAGGKAAGSSAAAALALAEGVLKAMLAARLRLASGVLIALTIAVLGAGALTRPAEAQKPPEQATREQGPAVKPAVQPKGLPAGRALVSGQVLSAAGKPLEQVEVALVGESRRAGRGGDLVTEPTQILGQGRTDARGGFRLEVVKIEPSSFREVHLLARAPGHGLTRQRLNAGASLEGLTVRLTPERVLRGRLVDLQGQPAVGVTVYLGWVGQSRNGMSEGISFFGQPERLAVWPAPVRTDKEGRFALAGLGASEEVSVTLSADRFAPQNLFFGSLKEEMPVNRSLAPAQWIEGRVLQADTGKPVARALLTVYASDNEFGGGGGLGGRADAEGRFRLNPYAGKFFTVSAHAPDGEPYLGIEKRIKWAAGKVKTSVELKLPRGVLVRGKVTEAPSGKPVAGAAVQFIPRHANNPFYRSDVITDWAGNVETGEDGTFRMPVLPGPGHLMVLGPTGEYVHLEVGSSQLYNGKPGGMRYCPDGLVKLDLTADQKEKEVAVKLRRGVTVRGRLVGPNGEAVGGALMICRLHVTHFSPFWRFPVEVRDGRFELPGLDPAKSYPVHFLEPKKQWGATVTLAGKQAGEPVTVRLGPCGQATARIVGSDGKPLANHRPTLEIVVTPGALRYDREASRKGLLQADSDFLANIDRHNYWNSPLTDARGRVTFSSLIPGVTYRLLTVRRGETVLGREFTVTAGKTLDLGDVMTSQGE